MNRLVNQTRGVTLIELMIVLVIVGIIAGLAGPQYGSLMKRKALLSESIRITSLLKLARSEARARGSYVVLSRIDGDDWSGEIEVYESLGVGGVGGGNKAFDAGTNDELIRQATESGRVLSADASLGDRFITFTPRGWVREPFKIAICTSSADSESGRFIEVNRVGKINEGPIGAEACDQ